METVELSDLKRSFRAVHTQGAFAYNILMQNDLQFPLFNDILEIIHNTSIKAAIISPFVDVYGHQVEFIKHMEANHKTLNEIEGLITKHCHDYIIKHTLKETHNTGTDKETERALFVLYNAVDYAILGQSTKIIPLIGKLNDYYIKNLRHG